MLPHDQAEIRRQENTYLYWSGTPAAYSHNLHADSHQYRSFEQDFSDPQEALGVDGVCLMTASDRGWHVLHDSNMITLNMNELIRLGNVTPLSILPQSSFEMSAIE